MLTWQIDLRPLNPTPSASSRPSSKPSVSSSFSWSSSPSCSHTKLMWRTRDADSTLIAAWHANPLAAKFELIMSKEAKWLKSAAITKFSDDIRRIDSVTGFCDVSNNMISQPSDQGDGQDCWRWVRFALFAWEEGVQSVSASESWFFRIFLVRH